MTKFEFKQLHYTCGWRLAPEPEVLLLDPPCAFLVIRLQNLECNSETVNCLDPKCHFVLTLDPQCHLFSCFSVSENLDPECHFVVIKKTLDPLCHKSDKTQKTQNVKKLDPNCKYPGDNRRSGDNWRSRDNNTKERVIKEWNRKTGQYDYYQAK